MKKNSGENRDVILTTSRVHPDTGLKRRRDSFASAYSRSSRATSSADRLH